MNNNNSGLHVSPDVDDVLKWTSPHCPSDKGIDVEELKLLDCWIDDTVTPNVKNSHNYPYYIPSDHYPGTHWYVQVILCNFPLINTH